VSESLKDQLIKAGLISPERAEAAARSTKTQRDRRKPSAPRRKKTDRDGGIDLAQAYKARERAERVAREQAQRERAEAEARRKAAKEQIRALVAAHRCNDEAAEHPYHFQVGERIKHIYVREDQRTGLASGELAILLMDGQRHLLPAAVGREVLALDPERFVLFPGEEGEPQPPRDEA
jgi:uncharacterized protein YaiL (DUF2058 family)